MRASSRTAAAVGVALLTLLGAQVALFHGVRHDDAYITFRYGQNLAEGAGMSFNPGERIVGSTSPGHLLLSALGYRLAGREALPGLMSALGCLGWLAQAAALFFLLRRALGEAGAGLIALAIALGLAGSAQWVALETNLVAALALWAIALGVEKRWMGAALVLAGAVLMRPDALVLALPLGLLCALDLRARCAFPSLLGLAALSPWLIYSTARFGSPIPQSARAKLHLDSLAAYAPQLFEHLPGELTFHPAPDLALDALWLLALAGALLVIRRAPRLSILPAWLSLHIAAYLWLRPGAAFAWHLYPAVLLFAALALVPAALLLRGPLPARLCGAVALAGALLLAGRGTIAFARSYPDSRFYGARDRAYRAAAAQLVSMAKPGDRFSAQEVGTLAYWSGLPANDEAGLITLHPKEALEQVWRGLASQPRFVVGEPGSRALPARSFASVHEVREPGLVVQVLDLGAP